MIQKLCNAKLLEINMQQLPNTHVLCVSRGYSMLMFKSFELPKFWKSPLLIIMNICLAAGIIRVRDITETTSNKNAFSLSSFKSRSSQGFQ